MHYTARVYRPRDSFALINYRSIIFLSSAHYIRRWYVGEVVKAEEHVYNDASRYTRLRNIRNNPNCPSSLEPNRRRGTYSDSRTRRRRAVILREDILRVLAPSYTSATGLLSLFLSLSLSTQSNSSATRSVSSCKHSSTNNPTYKSGVLFKILIPFSPRIRIRPSTSIYFFSYSRTISFRCYGNVCARIKTGAYSNFKSTRLPPPDTATS